MSRYFEGLPFEKVMINGKECYKSKDGCFYRIDEGKTFVAIECAANESDAKIDDFEDVDMFDKDTEKTDMTNVIRACLKELVA